MVLRKRNRNALKQMDRNLYTADLNGVKVFLLDIDFCRVCICEECTKAYPQRRSLTNGKSKKPS